MLGPYKTNKDGTINYKGNKIYPPIENLDYARVPLSDIENRVKSLHDNPMWSAISKINNAINTGVVNYFNSMGAIFVPLPMTTRMISSPGAVYGREAINYTTDTCPITLDWFGLPKRVFLSESSQIYLELALLQKGINHVFSNYHSFRKEKSDLTHLPEFHHIEYEGHVNQKNNLRIAYGLLSHLIYDLLTKQSADLSLFLTEAEMLELDKLSKSKVQNIPMTEALNLLYKDTGNYKYRKFTLQNFGFWEEVRLTEIAEGMVGISDMPIREVSFYHARKEENKELADNTDIIWPGYREIIGSGHRVESTVELEEKAKIFKLPREDYEPYHQSRKFGDYQESSGFGMGLERLIQGLLKMPFIHFTVPFPRTDVSIGP